MKQVLDRQGKLSMDDFDVHWHLDRFPDSQPTSVVGGLRDVLEKIEASHGALRPHQRHLLEQKLSTLLNDPDLTVGDPRVRPTRGRPSGSQNTSTSKRIRSTFEVVEDAERGRRCRVCNGTGHNARTCTQRNAHT